MGIVNRDGALYSATGIDNTGLYSGRREALGIIKAMAGEITSFDIFGGIGISAALAFAQAAKEAYSFEKQFQQSMKGVATLSSGIKGSLTDYMNQVIEITRMVPIAGDEAAKALYQIVSAGHDGANGMKILEVSAKAAIGGVTDTATSADGITTLLNAYKLDVSEAEKISDQLFTTVRLGKTSFGELGKSIAQVAPIAASYGVETDQVLAAVATLTKQGTPTAQAMTQIRASIIAVSKVLGDGAFDTRTYQEALAEVARQADGSETKLRELVPEVEAVNAVLGLTGINVQEAAGHLGEMQNAAGAAEAAFKEMASSAENQLKLLGNNVNAALRPLGQGILKEISAAAQSMNESFEDGSAQEALENIGGLIVVVTTALAGYKGSIIAVSAAKQIQAAVTAIVNKQRVIEAANLVLSKGMYAAEAAMVARNTSARLLLTKAIKAQTIAQLKNAAAMLTNPYVLAAAAFAALGYAIYKCATAETVAEKATRMHNAALEAQKKHFEDLKSKAEEYLEIIRSEISTQYDKEKALNSLQNIMPTIFKNMDIEKLKLMDELSLRKQIAEEINRRERIGAKTNLVLKTNAYNEAKSIYGNTSSKHSDVLVRYAKVVSSREDMILAQKQVDNILNIQKKAEESLKPKELKIVSLQSNIDTLKAEIAEMQLLVDKEKEETGGWSPTSAILDAKKGQLSSKEKEMAKLSPNKTGKAETKAKIQNEAYWTKQKNDAETELKALSDIEASGRKGAELKKKITEYQGKIDIFSPNTSKQEKQSDKLREEQEKYNLLMDKQKLDQIRSEEDLQMQVDDARIKAMDEGSKKTITQMELNFEKEMQTIDRQKEDALRKKIEDDRKEFEDNPENKKKPFDATGIELSNDEKKKYDALYKSEIEYFEQDKQRMEFQHMQDYLKEYGTFQQKKLAIAKEYDEKIRNSQNEWERKSFAKERDTKISGLETDAIKANIDWVAVFGEFGGMFNDMIKPALEKAKEYVKTDKFKNSDQDSQKSLIDAINQMEKSLGGAEGVNFKKLGQDIKAYQLAEQNRILAIESEADAINKLKKAQEDYEKAIKSGTETEKLSAKDALDNAQQNADAASTNVKVQTEISNQSQQDVTDTATKLKANMDNVTEGLSKLASGGIKNAYDGLIQAGKGMGGAIEAVSDKLEDVPIIGWIVSIIDVFKDGLSDLVGGLLDSIFNAVSGIISDVLSGDLFVTIGKSLASGVGKILNSITFGGFNSWFNVNGNEKETAEKIEKLTNSNEALKTSIDGLTKKMEESNGVKSIDYYQKAKYAQDRSNENYRQILDAQMRYSSAHHSNSYYWDLNKSSLSQVNNLLGTNLKNSWADFSKLTSEQMNDIRTQLPDIWSEMIDEGKYGDRFKDDWNNYADQAGKIEELTEKINENIAQISFDGLRDSFIDSLMDMDASAEDFANKFEEYLMRSMLNFSVGDMIDDDMKAWYNSWAETIGKQNGELTPEQIKQYKKEWDDMVQKGIDKRNDLAELTGYDPSSSSSQDSTQKGFAAMSQDTGNELNGRFTALQISNEEIKNQLIFQSGIQGDMLRRLDEIYKFNAETSSERSDMMLSVIDYLEGICQNTNSLPRMEKLLEDIKRSSTALAGK